MQRNIGDRPPVAAYLCKWGTCRMRLESADTLATHLKQERAHNYRKTQCMWSSCDKLFSKGANSGPIAMHVKSTSRPSHTSGHARALLQKKQPGL